MNKYRIKANLKLVKYNSINQPTNRLRVVHESERRKGNPTTLLSSLSPR